MSYANTANGSNPKGSPRRPFGPSKTLVVGLGNPILGDDGIGWCVAESVKARAPDVEVDCLALGGLSLMERLVGYDRVIIIDAIQTQDGQIGDVTCFPLQALPDLSAGHTTAIHDTSLQTALKLGRAMGAQLPQEVIVVAVEAERIYDFSEELSPAVAQSIPEATQVVIDQLANLKEKIMISPEVLRRYPFFSFMNHGQLREVAMITDEIEIGDGKILFSVGDVADALYLLREGAIDLHYVVIDENEPLLRKDFYVGNVNPGEVFGVSSVIEPFQYKAAAVVNGDSHLLKMEAAALRNLCEDDRSMAYGLIYQIAKAAMDKLHATRIQLAGSKDPL